MSTIDLNLTTAQRKEAGSIITTYEEGGKFFAKANSGKKKDDFHFRFRTDAQRQEYVARYIVNRTASLAAKVSRAAEKKADRASLNAVAQFPIGTIIYSSWGWEQTNLDFYKVVGHTGKLGCKVVAIGMESTTAHSGMSADYMPVPDKTGKDVLNARQSRPDSLKLSGSDYALYRWDGRPKYCSWYA